MMYEIAKDFPNEIFSTMETPCISLYQPTHRYSPENKQDPIVFKNLLRDIESSLKLNYAEIDIHSIMKPFYQLTEEKNFWNHTLDGLAIFATLHKCIVYRLNRPVQEQAIIADSLYIKPLIRIFQSADNYQLLGVSRSEFALYEGNRDGLEEMEMDQGTPRTIEEVLGAQLTDSYLTFGSYGSGDGTPMYHGHGGKQDEIDKDTEKFFRYVDSFVLETYSKASRLPLILVAVKEHHNLFRKISNNPYLMEEGVKASYESLTKEQLNEKAWELVEPVYLAKNRKLVDTFEAAKASAAGSDDLAQIVKAAFENRVETILIEAHKFMPGKIDEKTGDLETGSGTNLNNDILDDLIEIVLKKKGEVVVLPKEIMPGNAGVAAIYRY